MHPASLVWKKHTSVKHNGVLRECTFITASECVQSMLQRHENSGKLSAFASYICKEIGNDGFLSEQIHPSSGDFVPIMLTIRTCESGRILIHCSAPDTTYAESLAPGELIPYHHDQCDSKLGPVYWISLSDNIGVALANTSERDTAEWYSSVLPRVIKGGYIIDRELLRGDPVLVSAHYCSANRIIAAHLSMHDTLILH